MVLLRSIRLPLPKLKQRLITLAYKTGQEKQMFIMHVVSREVKTITINPEPRQY